MKCLPVKRIFTGDTVPHVLADVIRVPIDFDRVRKETPLAIRHLLQRCLDRDLNNSLRDIGEARGAINNAGKKPEAAMAGVSARHRLLPWITAGVLAIGFIATAWFAYRTTRPAELKPLVRLDVDLGSDVVLGNNAYSEVNVILSPDRTRRPCVSNDRLFARRFTSPSC
jgi:hypothetical protein